MKKLMVMVLGAAMACTTFGAACTPEQVIEQARVYKMQLNAYTTKGIANGATVGGTACVPGENICLVRRGKAKTIFRGYVFICTPTCGLSDYNCVLSDRRSTAPCANPTVEFTMLNRIGLNNNEVECSYNLNFEAVFDSVRSQRFEITGCGYGAMNNEILNTASGYFTGTGSASYDLTTKANDAVADCLCSPSQVLNCDSDDLTDYQDADTVCFGMWKLRYDNAASSAYTAGQFSPDIAIADLAAKNK